MWDFVEQGTDFGTWHLLQVGLKAPQSSRQRNYKIYTKRITLGDSGQDGGIGRHTSLPCTTIRRITTTSKQKTPRPAKKLNCMEVQQPRI